ncbi:hypothetical protein BH23BAC2_BH23BAC2_00790 [soil metagenome]
MKPVIYIIVAILITSCGGPQAVYDYDEKTSFTAISTYQIFPELASELNQLDEQRLISILSEEMAAKGFTTAGSPQIYVNFYSSEYQTSTRNSVGVGVGGTGRNVGVGISGGIPIGGPDTYRKLTFDFIDVEKDILVWQAIVEGKFDLNTSPEKRAERLRVMVKKALDGYPPKR